MPISIFTVKGDIEDFTRLDNLYSALKRETEKLLKNWTIDVAVTYSEKQGDKPVK